MSTPETSEPIHFASVPAHALPGLVEHRPKIDTGQREFERTIAGKLLTADRHGDVVHGTLEMLWPQRHRPIPAWKGGGWEYRATSVSFRLDAGERVTAHLPASVLAVTEGAYDIEDRRAVDAAIKAADHTIALMAALRGASTT